MTGLLRQNLFRYARPGDPARHYRGDANLSPYLTANRDRAMQELRKVVAENPVDRDALIRLGNLCMACGQFFEAAHCYGLLRQLIQQRDISVLRALAESLSMCERTSEAIQTYDELLTADPSDIATALALAALLSHAEQHTQAVRLLAHTVVRAPNNTDLLESLAQSLIENGDFERAVLTSKQFTRFTADSATAWNLLGIAQIGAEQRQEAETSFEKAITLQPHFVDAYLNLAALYKTTGRLAESLGAFEYAQAVYRSKPTCWLPAFDKDIAEISLLSEQRNVSRSSNTLQPPDLACDGNFTLLVGCYGNFPEYSVRVMDSIESGHCVRELCRIHIGLNECCQQTIDRARQLRDQGLISLLIESPLNLNKDKMFRLLLDAVVTPYVLWVDDDNQFEDADWPACMKQFIISNHPFDVAGRIASWGPSRFSDPGYVEFIRSRPWWRTHQHQPGRLRNWIPFAPGGIFLARTEFLRKHGFPDRGMIKAMDDVALGEMIQQVGGRLVPFTSDLLKIAKTDGKRRGEGMTLADGVLR